MIRPLDIDETKGRILTKPEIGATVRLYADSLNDCFDEGKVIAVEHGVVIVEFCDWQQMWPVADLRSSGQCARRYFEPLSTGTVVRRFPVGRKIVT
jgi:hypothetical protein